MTRRSATSETKRPEVVAVYCPLWHNYDHASSWKGEGWCEWELLRQAKPRFKGHYQPLRPEWGCFDESDPRWSAKEIALAADHGIDVFLVDWYWYSGVRLMEEALERGLLRARNRQRVRFALMWANHPWADYFPAPFGQRWNSWLPSRHTEADWLRVMAYCGEHYFNQPHYWQVAGRLFFSLFEPLRLVRELGGARAFRRLLATTDRQLARAKLPPLHLNAMVGGPRDVDELRDAGYASTTSYNVTGAGRIGPTFTERYEDVVAAHVARWQSMARTALPYSPVVTTGWDVTPRCETTVPWPFPPSPLSGKLEYPYGPVVVGNTPRRFAGLCRQGLDFCRATQPTPNAVFVNAWNEWTEGCYLLPEKRYGTQYLEAIRATFGRQATRRLR